MYIAMAIAIHTYVASTTIAIATYKYTVNRLLLYIKFRKYKFMVFINTNVRIAMNLYGTIVALTI